MNIDNYLKRINYIGDTLPSYEVLCELQRQHLYHIPFENFNIHDNVPILLDERALFEKIVTQFRGGFCYELNTLFCALLNKLGFQTKLVSANVYGNGEYGKPFDHMAIVVTIDDIAYLSDVGFGEFSVQPLIIDTDDIQNDPRGDFIIKPDSSNFVIYKLVEQNQQAEYRFDLIARKIEDFSEMCHYHQTSTASHFTKKRLISLAKPNGRVTLSEKHLTIRNDGLFEEHELSASEYQQALEKYFSPFPLTR